MIDIKAELKRDNPRALAIDIEVYGDCLAVYAQAAHNIRKNGAVCINSRTGAPFENPFLKIQERQAAILCGMATIEGGRVLRLVTEGLTHGETANTD